MNSTASFERLDWKEFPNYINAAIPFFIGSMVLELCISLYTKKYVYRFNDAMNSISLGLCQEIVNIFVKPLNYIPYLYIWQNYAILRLGPDGWLAWWVALLGIDFGYYWFHRWGHVMNLGWATHVPHHSSDDYNLSTALRQGAFQYVFGWIFYLPLAFVCHPLIYSFHTYFNRLFQFWVHTQVIKRIGFLEHIFVTPSHHRVHHGSNPEYLDKNYGGVFIIWDKLFGTFEEERAVVRYGITTGLHSWSPFWGNLHYFAHMYEMSKHLKGISKLKVLYKGPEWSPAQAPKPVVNKNQPYVKYDAGSDLSAWYWVYIIIQIAGGLAVRKLLERHFSTLSPVSMAFMAIFVVWALATCGSLLQKVLTAQAEHLRIVVSDLMLFYVLWEAQAPQWAYGVVLAWALLSIFLFPINSPSQQKKMNSQQKNNIQQKNNAQQKVEPRYRTTKAE